MKLSADRTQEAARALVGNKYSEVAEMYGVTVHGLRNALKRHGLFAARQRGAYKLKLSREDLTLAVDMYKANKTLIEIEAVLNVGDEIIKRELKAAGLYTLKHCARYNKTAVLEMRKLRAEGKTYEQISDRYQAKLHTIRNIVNGVTWSHLPNAVPFKPRKAASARFY